MPYKTASNVLHIHLHLLLITPLYYVSIIHSNRKLSENYFIIGAKSDYCFKKNYKNFSTIMHYLLF